MAYLTLYLEDYREGFYSECPELRPEKPETEPSVDADSEMGRENSTEEESK